MWSSNRQLQIRRTKLGPVVAIMASGYEVQSWSAGRPCAIIDTALVQKEILATGRTRFIDGPTLRDDQTGRKVAPLEIGQYISKHASQFS